MTRRLGAFAALAALGLSLVVTLAAVPAAQAATGTAPVTTPDVGTMYPGNVVAVFPVNNDHDADNDALTICRIGSEHYKGLEVDFLGNELDVFSRPSVKPGTYTYTYYACDFSYLSAGTITVTVEKLPKIKVAKIDSRPGKLRVTNRSDLKVRFLYGSFKEDRPDGSLLLARHSAVVISVHRTRIDWIATSRKGDLFFGSGHVDGIKLARAVGRALAHASLSSRLALAWRSA